MMKLNEKLRAEILQIVKNQLDNNDPPETNIAYSRLRNLGYNKEETLRFIGQCIAIEIFDVLKHKQPFNKNRYLKNLSQLPNEPFL